MKKISTAILMTALLACNSNDTQNKNNKDSNAVVTNNDTSAMQQVNDTTPILQKKQVPILCYHQIRDWTGSDSKGAKDYIIPVNEFKQHMKMLKDSGYNSVLPDQVYAYLTKGTPLPEKPVMITFDDTDDDQFDIAKPELDKYGYKGVFFIMTVSIGRPRYMTKEQIKQLSDEGHTIGAHTWDHHMVTKYDTVDHRVQLKQPKALLEKITGKPVNYFAYPFGLWNDAAIPAVKEAGYTAAFQLATKRSETDPIYTIRRIIASGYWSANTLNKAMNASFK